MASKELACVYAALILNDDKIEITADKINSILNAANVNIETYWIELFVQYFKTHDISEIIKSTQLGNNQAASQSNETISSKDEEEKEKEDKNEEEEVEFDRGFDDLFN